MSVAGALRATMLLISLAAGGCASDAEPGPLAPESGARMVTQGEAGGRIWRVYNDCTMFRNVTWVSDDGGRRWLHYEGPGGINCTSSSDVRIKPSSRDEATAEVDHGPEPIHEVWHTTNGGRKWTLTSTDLGG